MISHYDKNTAGRDFIVGDLHGCYELLIKQMDLVSFDKSKDRLFCTGDMIDRGADSLKCLNLAFESWFFSVWGNHEQMMYDALTSRNDQATSHWIRNGGAWAFSGDNIDDVAEIIIHLREEIPVWLDIDKRIGIVHAEPPKSWGEISDKESAIWSRSKISHQDESVIEGIEKVYVGHSIVKSPINLGNVRYIDTGAFHTNVLTLEIIE